MNTLEKYLNKKSENFTKKDIMKFVSKNGISAVNFRYVAGDGRLKTLNFSLSGEKYLDRILSCGERVDGSSLFKGIDAASSDLYVVPKYSSAFVNPFSPIPALDIICSFYDKEGNPFSSSPDNILKKACLNFEKESGCGLYALGELEYYLIAPRSSLYPTQAQKGYHESYPFNKWEFLRVEAASLISQCGGHVKYAHSEVGYIRSEDSEMSQHEIEFLPVPAQKAAEEIAIARWILFSLGYKYGVTITFAPKISVGHAGSGFHIHSCLMKKNKNIMLKGRELSPEALKLIAGYLKAAKSLTAFGNTVPTSYLRLVPNQEAPVNICWGYRNRSALIRVPLGWTCSKNMACDLNPAEKKFPAPSHAQTVEIRSADGSANVYFLLAGLACAAAEGFRDKNAEAFAKAHYAEKNVFKYKESGKNFPSLPSSCAQSAKSLLEERAVYEKGGFPSQVVDSCAAKLSSYGDENLSEKLYGKDEEIKKVVDEYLYC
ncbi:MAG: glutamine synthetase [Elusimicrobia bacterium]|nr:glutamine synthetase [Elusimicrobiota bacterium]